MGLPAFSTICVRSGSGRARIGLLKSRSVTDVAITGSQASVILSWERPESLAATVCDGQTSRVWVIDITSIRTYDGFPNLAVVTPA